VLAWTLNRYHYQAMIPVKDASLIARCDDPALRRDWRRRLVDHDGESEGDGGIARWFKLTDGVGLDRDYVVSLAGLLPATRFAVEAYVHFVRDKILLEAVASSLTELFSPQIISERLEGMLKGYDFVSADTLAYSPSARRSPSVTPRRRTPSRPCSKRLNSNATCYGPCSTRSTMPMWRRSIFRPAPSCPRTGGGAADRSQHRHRLRRAPTAAARRSARPQRGAGRLGATCARAGLQGRRDRGRDY